MSTQSEPAPQRRPHAAPAKRRLGTLAKITLGLGALFAAEHTVDGAHEALAGHGAPHDLHGALAGIEYQNHVLDSIGSLQGDIDFHDEIGNVENGLNGSLYVDY